MSWSVKFKIFLYYISFLADYNDTHDDSGDDAEDEVIKSLNFCFKHRLTWSEEV